MDRRKKNTPKNIYVNHFPEWSRAMADGNPIARRQVHVRCPKCGSTDTRQSATRTLMDYALFLFNYTNARCRSCSGRFRIWKSRSEQPASAAVTEAK